MTTEDKAVEQNDYETFAKAFDEPAEAPVAKPAEAATDVAKDSAATTETEAAPDAATTEPVAKAEGTDTPPADKSADAKPVETPAPVEPVAKAEGTDTPPADEKPKESPWYTPTDEEKAVVESYEKEWGDIFKAQSVVTKAATYNTAKYIFEQIHKSYDPIMQRFALLSDAMETELTLNQLRAAHPDYDAVVDKVEAWVKTLPAAHRRGAEQVILEGTPDEVIDLVADYKKANPVKKTEAPAAPASEPRQITEAAKKAADKLKPTDSKRTVATTTPDPGDYDSAWAEAVANDR
jgi:hypothetical protein